MCCPIPSPSSILAVGDNASIPVIPVDTEQEKPCWNHHPSHKEPGLSFTKMSSTLIPPFSLRLGLRAPLGSGMCCGFGVFPLECFQQAGNTSKPPAWE